MPQHKLPSLNAKNMCVSNALKIPCIENPNLLKTVLSKIECWFLKHLTLTHQDFTFFEWQKIVTENTLISCFLENCTIRDEVQKHVPLEELFKYLNFVEDFTFKTLENDCYTPSTSNILSKMDRKSKLKNFENSNVPVNFNPFCYGEFIQKYAAPNATFKIHFIANMEWLMKNEFFTIVNRMLSQWNPSSEKPILNYNNFKDFI